MDRKEELDPAAELGARLQEHSAQLNAFRALPEPNPTSRIPLLGPLLALLSRVANRVTTHWEVAPLREQQQRFNAEATAAFDEVAAAVTTQARQLAALSASIKIWGRYLRGRPTGDPVAQGVAARSGDQDEVAALLQLSAEELRAWEQADCPEGMDTCHESEVANLRNVEVGISFPLHWTIQDIGWNYLFNMAVVGPALNCRPGDLILDFAGSSGWASEFLNRFGVNTVLLDYSDTPLHHSRLRFTADRRLLQYAQVHPVRGDGLRLPFADNTFDGIICMNAFHHMPSYETALREMARVLKPGCRAAFGEPGESHASVPVSRWTMEQQGVYEKNVPLDLVYVYAMRSGFSHMVRYPYTYPLRVELPYPETGRSVVTVLDHLQETLPMDLSNLSLFALQKEGERLVDSSAPRWLLDKHLLRGDIRLMSFSETVPAGSTFVDHFHIRNSGGVVWLAETKPMGGYVRLGIKLYDEQGRQLDESLPRPSFPRDMFPGEEIDLQAPLTAPTAPGTYILRYDLVDEWRTWFEDMGSQVVERRLIVAAS